MSLILEGFDNIDVFASFDAAAGHLLDVDPYPAFEDLRAAGPIVKADLHDALGIDRSIAVTAQASGYAGSDADVFSAVSYEAVDHVLRDAGSFTQEIHRRAYRISFGRSINTLDPPEHRRERALVEQAFARRSMEGWTEEIIGPLAVAGAGAAAAIGQVDLLDAFVFRFPAVVIARLLGTPDDQVDSFMRVAAAVGSFHHPDLAAAAASCMTKWIGEEVSHRRESQPTDDVLGLLSAAQLDGEQLSVEQIASFVRLLFPAGFETTYRSLANIIVGLLMADQWRLIVKNRSLIPLAVEEGLRWQTPLLGHPRFAAHDVTVCGADIPAGSVVHAFHAAANRDPQRWSSAERFDVTRTVAPHSTFGFGPHICLGMHLARVEAIAALNALADAAPRMQLDTSRDAGEYCVRGLAYRSPRSIPVIMG